MAYKVKLNGTNYPLKDGFIIQKELNETLDTGTIQFSLINNEVDLEAFDEVVIFDDAVNPSITPKKQLVNSAYDDTISFEPTLDKAYTINTFSKTKWLERITTPCLTTTKVNPSHDVYYYINTYCNLYVPKIRRKNGASWSWDNKYHLSSRVQDKFEDVICPEFQWNPSTLREVLTDLMSVKNCIPVINENNEIDYIDLSMEEADKNEIDISKLSLVRKTITAEDYCTDLTINMKNALGKSKTRVVEYKSLRAVDSGILETTNAVFTTDKPIYNIIKCLIYFPDSNSTNTYAMLNITDRIKEQQEWNILKTSRYFNASTDEEKEEAKQLKACNLHYKRGGNTIEGWGTQYTMYVDLAQGSDDPTVGWIYRLIREGASIIVGTTEIAKHLRDITVKIEYETVDENSLHIGRYLPSKHEDNKIFDNQKESYVDTEQQGIFEYIKINRLSNATIQIFGTYFNENDIPQLADVVGDYVLYNSKVEYLDHQFNFEGTLIKNFVLRDYFTGIQAKKRSWAIASGSEATTRTDIYKHYVEASFDLKREIISGAELTITAIDFLSPLLTNFEFENLKWACISTFSVGSGKYPEDVLEDYALDLHTNAIGKSIVMSFSFNDNYSAGDYIETYVESGTTKYLNQFYKYADENGEFFKMDLVLTDYITPQGDNNFEYPMLDERKDYSSKIIDISYDALLPLAREKPKIQNGKVEDDEIVDLIHRNIRIFKNLYKDQREIIAGSVQFEYCADTTDILINDEFIKRNKFVATKYREKYDTSMFVIVGEVYPEYGVRYESGAEDYPTPTADLLGTYLIVRVIPLHSGAWLYEYRVCQAIGGGYEWAYVGAPDDLYFTLNNEIYQFKIYHKGDAILQQAFLELRKGTPITNDLIKESLNLYLCNKQDQYNPNTKPRIYDMDFLPVNKTHIAQNDWDYSIAGITAFSVRLRFTLRNLMTKYDYLYLCDETDHVLLAITYDMADTYDEQNIDIFFNVLKSRDTNIYDNNDEVVGNIIE